MNTTSTKDNHMERTCITIFNDRMARICEYITESFTNDPCGVLDLYSDTCARTAGVFGLYDKDNNILKWVLVVVTGIGNELGIKPYTPASDVYDDAGNVDE